MLAVDRVAESRVVREMDHLVGQESARLLETREEMVFLELLMVVLDEAADDPRGVRERPRGEVRSLCREAAQAFLVDEKHAVENSVLAHQVFRRSDLPGRLFPPAPRGPDRDRERHSCQTNPAEK